MERTEILKSQGRLAQDKMNRNKAAEPDRIAIEMLSVLDNFRINKNKLNI